MKSIIITTIAFSVILGYLVWQAPGIEEIDAYEKCVQEQYGMSAVEAYQKLGVERCNK